MTAFDLNREERDLIKSALRQLANHVKKTKRQHPTTVRNWTDEKEAANPGFRAFLIDEVPKRHEARLARIEAVRVKLRLTPFETFDENEKEEIE